MASNLIIRAIVTGPSPRTLAGFLAYMWLMVGGGGAVGGQAPARPESSHATFKAGVQVVTVSATVRDNRGRVVKNLKRTDFQVFENGVQRSIRDFYPGEAPISLAVLLDISGSMSVGGNMDRARRAFAQALSELQTGRDEAALYTFDRELQEVRAFTNDLSRVASVSLAGRPWGQTSLYDAIDKAAQKVTDRPTRHRAVLVITDGIDTASRLSAPEVSGIASSIDVPVYLVVVASPVDNPGHELAVIEADGATSEVATLADLARWTGGDMAVVSALDDSLLALKTLMGELRHQYLITFDPSGLAGWHRLEVRLPRNKHLVVRARGGYMADRIEVGATDASPVRAY